MNKVKKLIALLLTAAIVFAMGMTGVAADGKPQSTDTATVKITGITGDPTVTLYQIAKAEYGPNGTELVQYNWADGAEFQDEMKPTADEINKIAQGLTGTEGADAIKPFTTITTGTLSNGTYTATVPAGVYIAILTEANDGSVYNPILLSATYGEKGNLETNIPDEVESTDSYLWGTTAVAKKRTPDVTKEITDGTVKDEDKDTAGLGDVVSYEAEIVMPSYPNNATNKTVFLTDTLSDGLTFLYDSLTVTIDGQTVTKAVEGEISTFKLGDKVIATAEKKDNGFYLNFSYDDLISNSTTGAVYTPVVTYDGVVNEDAIVGNSGNPNTIDYYYANKPNVGETWDEIDQKPDQAAGVTKKTDTETVYTYQIAFRKTDEKTKTPLSGAVFGVYKDQGCTELIDQVQTNENGYAVSTQVSKGTYYLKELVAPEGYALNTNVYSVDAEWTTATTTTTGEVTARTYTTENPNGAPQVGWIKDGIFYELDEMTEEAAEAGGYQAAYLASENTTSSTTTTITENQDGGGTVALEASIPNTQMHALPSTGGIGTTIFTIGGCVIMIAAAGLYFASRKKNGDN